MSMISAQIDELRELAGDGSMEWVTGPIRATVLREAADTIWELRDDLQRANAENATLRQQLADVTESMGRVEERCAKLRDELDAAKHDLQVFSMGSVQLDAENAKLRELVEDMMRFFEDGSYCTTCEKVDECDASEIYEYDCLMHSVFTNRMRELGVEVDW